MGSWGWGVDRFGRLISRTVSAVAMFSVLALGGAVASASAAPADLDTSFSGDGKFTYDSGDARGSRYEESHAFEIDDAGRAYIGTTYGRVSRLTSTGAVDTSFGGDGEVVIGADPGTNDQVSVGASVKDIAIDDDGRAVLLLNYRRREAIGDFYPRFAVARLTEAGTLDPSFGGGDGLVTPFPDGTVETGQLAGYTIDARDQRIAIGGLRTGPGGADREGMIGLLDAAGDGVSTFGGDGFVFPGGGLEPIGEGVEIDSQGRVVFASTTGPGVDIARLTTAGTLDGAYGTGGVKSLTAASFGANGLSVFELDLDPSDRALIVSQAVVTDGFDFGMDTSTAQVTRLTSAGQLDTTFGSGTTGTRQIDLGDNTSMSGIERRSDGKLVGFVSYYNWGGSSGNFVVRLTDSGGFDGGYGGGDGLLPVSYGGTAHLDGSDRIYFRGSEFVGGSYRDTVVRLTAEGALDQSYGSGGQAPIEFVETSNDEPSAGLVDSQGRTVVAIPAAAGEPDSEARYRLVRFTSAGSLDGGFGEGGSFRGPADQNGSWTPRGIVETGTGGYLVTSANGLAMLDSTGAPVEDFADDGFLTFGTSDPPFAEWPCSNAIDSAIDGNGRIVVVVSGHDCGMDGGNFVARFNADGTVDTSFGDNGIGASLEYFGAGHATRTPESVAVDSQNRIVVAGVQFTFSGNTGWVTRVTAGGELDNSFSDDGTALAETESGFFSVAIDASDRPVIGGLTGVQSFGAPHASCALREANQALIARLTTAGDFDSGFSGDGLAAPAPTGQNRSCIDDIAVDPDGRIVGSGTHAPAQPNGLYVMDFLVVRLLGNGNGDGTFGTGGATTIDFSTEPIGYEDPQDGYEREEQALTAAIAPTSGAITVAGYRGGYGGAVGGAGSNPNTGDADVAIARLQGTVPTNKTLTVRRTGTGEGLVTSSPAGISCGGFCSKAYAPGTSVTLTAATSPGSTFGGWQGCDSSTGNQCTVAMSSVKSVEANFSAITHDVTVTKAGTGTGTVTADGIDCGIDCAEAYEEGTTVTLTADPDSGSELTGWSGCDSTDGLECQVDVDADRQVTATFGPATVPQRALTVNRTGNGTVTSSPAGINCGSDCTHDYADDTTVELDAAPAAGSQFNGWTGCSSIQPDGDCVVSMTANRTVSASFGPAPSQQRTLTVLKSGSGTVTGPGISCGADCTQAYDASTLVTLNAGPAAGFDFGGWAGCDAVVNGGTGCQVTMSATRSVTANFDPEAAPGLPNTTITKVKVSSKGAAKVSFTDDGGQGPLSFECKLDKGAYKPCSSPKKFKPGPGKHTVSVMAIDSTGAEDPTPAKSKFKVKK